MFILCRGRPHCALQVVKDAEDTIVPGLFAAGEAQRSPLP